MKKVDNFCFYCYHTYIQEKEIAMKKWIFILGLGLFLTGCAPEQTKEGLSPEELYTKGYEFFQKKEYETAAECFDEVEKQHPYSIWSERAQIMAAYSYYQKNQYKRF